jgi:hypothetical protein
VRRSPPSAVLLSISVSEPLLPPAEKAPPTTHPAGPVRTNRVRVGIFIAAAFAVALIVWALTGRDTSSKPTSPSAVPIGPVAVSASGLATLGRSVGQPIYWAGPRKGYLYELKRDADGNVYVRYLPSGVKVGAPGGFLTVATYPFAGAFQALENVKDAQHVSIPRGGLALIGQTYKKSIHLAFPNVDYQVEVYDPSAARALEIVTSGQVRPAR